MQEFNRLKDTRHGRMLYNLHDQYIGRSIELYGEFSEGETELFDRIVQPGDVVLDVGANIGAHTIWMARKTGLQGAVLAFEPQRLVFQALCANMALNSIVNAFCFNQAVGAEPGEIIVPVLDPNRMQNFGGLGLGTFNQGDPIPVIQLDTIPIGRCKLIKVDVEGMELGVLQGAQKLIERTKPVLYVENDRPDRSEELIKFIANMVNYDLYWHRPPLYNPNNFFKNPENVFGDIVSLNMLCVPKGVEVVGLPRVEIPA